MASSWARCIVVVGIVIVLADPVSPLRDAGVLQTSQLMLTERAVLFLDPLPCGFSVSYFVDEAQRYVAVVRVRRTAPGGTSGA